jgi:NADPH:quinone reductase-like Zn-dependent oxidoreductase
VNATPTADKLRSLGELASSGDLRVPIQGVHPIERADEALAAFQQGTRGKLIVRI